MDDLEAAALAIAEADRAVAMTGAGVSTASGVPDFRSDGGLWDRYDPEAFHVGRFERDPAGFWELWLEIQEEVFEDADVVPNPAHEALAGLEAAGHLDAVVTQNVDGLHQAAGSDAVIELHGTHDRVECRRCGRKSGAGDAVARARDDECPPRCDACSGVLKPASVLFGETLPESALIRAHVHAEKSDAFLVAGSSLTVEPAASLPQTAAETGATLIVVNDDPTPHDGLAACVFRDDVTDVLPRIREAVSGVAE